MWEAAVEYFDWVEANPLWEDKVTSYQGINSHEPVSKMRAMTIGGLCIFLDISRVAWLEYSKRQDFINVTRKIDEIIRDQKFSGAAADLLNANIIARDLGLAEKSEVTGADGGPIKSEATSDRDLAKAVAFLLAKGMNANS